MSRATHKTVTESAASRQPLAEVVALTVEKATPEAEFDLSLLKEARPQPAGQQLRRPEAERDGQEERRRSGRHDPRGQPQQRDQDTGGRRRLTWGSSDVTGAGDTPGRGQDHDHQHPDDYQREEQPDRPAR
jgi:hypothetical protein